MAVYRETVERLGEMVRVGLSPEEVDRLTEDMAAILEHVGRLQAIDTQGVAAEAHITGLRDVTREDVIEPSMSRKDVLANAPETRDGYFVVPAVFGER